MLFENARAAETTLERAREVLTAITNRFENADTRAAVLEAAGWLYEDDSIQAAVVLSAEDSPAFKRFLIGIRKSGLTEKQSSEFQSEIRKQTQLVVRPNAPSLESPYAALNSSMVYWKPDGQSKAVVLSNFLAKITREIVKDDGEQQQVHFEVVGYLGDRLLRPVQVAAEEFAAMNWVTKYWGSAAIVSAGPSMRDHLRAAIQTMSEEPPRVTVFVHLGWREIENQWLYLHAGGAIGSEGLVEEVTVQPPDPLRKYSLPTPPVGDDLKSAIRASLRAMGVAKSSITIPLLATIVRSVLGPTDFVVHLVGPSGVGKTAFVAVFLQHFGAGLDARNLPASWSSTGNALEGLAYHAKDAVLVVDDFSPTGTPYDVQRFRREADRFIRAQGNRSGRQRMAADASLKGAKRPRGTTISTGEDVPRGQSLRARMLVLEVARDDVNFDALTEVQAAAGNGVFAQALSAFVMWIAGRYGAIQERLKRQIAEARDECLLNAAHRRTPEIVANLIVGYKLYLGFAEVVGAITPQQNEHHIQEAWDAIGEAVVVQSSHQAAGDPAKRFVELLNRAISSGRAHVASEYGAEPRRPSGWGWREATVGAGENQREEWRPQGDRVGWVSGNGDLYLEPEASFAVVQDVGRRLGESLSVTASTLYKRLDEAGLLLTTGRATGRQSLKVRRMLEDARRSVLHLHANVLAGGRDLEEKPNA